jgi:HK97 family phage major capsid protein
VRYSSASDPDISSERDYFTKDTDFDIDEWPAKARVYFDHGMNPTLKRRKLGWATLIQDEFGIWAETILRERDEYEKFLAEMSVEEKMGWSSGTAPHLVERVPVGTAHFIKSWPLGLDASITHRPAEPRNTVVTLKSLSELNKPEKQAEHEVETVGDTVPSDGGATKAINDKELAMELTEEKLTEIMSAAAEQGAKKALDSLPVETKSPGTVTVTLDEGDRPFQSFGEQLIAVKNFEVTRGQNYDRRLAKYSVKSEVKVQNELVGSEGGFLVQQDFATQLLLPIHEQGPFSSRARRLPIGNNANSGTIPGVNETSRVTGSRWGGIRGYRLAEQELKHASDFAFREIEWRLKKYAVVVVSSEELLEDQSMLQEITRVGCSEELNFMLNDDMFRGAGAGGPLGFSVAPCVVTQAIQPAQLTDTINADNIINMYSRMTARSITNACWYINPDCFPQIQTLALAIGLGGVPLYIPPSGLAEAPYGTLLGRPVIPNEFSPTLGSAADISFADMSQYLWWEKSAPQAASSIHIYFLYDKTAFRFVYRVDGQPSWNAALTPYQGTTTTSPFVILATR